MARKNSIDKKNIITIDFEVDDNWSFVEILSNMARGQWVVKKTVTKRFHVGWKNVLRHFLYFCVALNVLLNRHRYNKIIGYQQFHGLDFALLSRMLHLKKVNDLTIMTFIYKRRQGAFGTLYHKYIDYAVSSKYVDRIICFAREECDYYKEQFPKARGKFVFVPLGFKPVEGFDISDNGIIFATGRSNRDYDFLIDTLKDSPYKVVIACDIYKNKNVPANVKILNNCYGKDMFYLMSCCHCVAIPLRDLKISSGQIVAIQAMSLGKPVICTDSIGLKDYVDNGATGFFFFFKKDVWLGLIKKLYDDKTCYKDMCIKSANAYKNEFSVDIMYKRIARIIG